MPPPNTKKPNSNKNIPTGTVTFLFTDIEGSTKLWETYPNEMNLALTRHDTILRQAIENYGGYVFKTVGDAFCAAFQTTLAGLLAALAAQRALSTEQWPTPSPIKVRMGLHTGEANERDNDYFGPTLNRVARMFAAGHGGQTLLSATSAAILRQQLPTQVTLQDMGLHHFKDLSQPEQVFQVITPDLPSEFAPLKSLDVATTTSPIPIILHSLPDDLFIASLSSSSQLIGREQEIADLRELLSQDVVRLVTLTGVGGTGKTRLSLSVARLLRNQFADGVSFVPLEIVTLRQTLIKEIATTLKVKEVVGEPLLDTLKTYLRDKQLLLVLDNFEQLVTQGATVLPELLKAAPKLKILVTSREVLQLSQEHEYPVEPLALPQINKPKLLLTATSLASYAAVALFVTRAQVVKADFSLTEDNAFIIAQICHKLDGLPFAIELAAARIKMLSPTKLLERLSDKLKVLTGGARDLPARQQTLRGAIDWSYDLLDPQEQALFRCLAIFAGGCTVESAEAVYINASRGRSNTSESVVVAVDDIDVLEGLTALANKSLLKQREDKNGEIRFNMLPTIREYGLEKLAEQQQGQELTAVELEYVKYFIEWVDGSESKLRSSNQLAELVRLDSDYDNLREVLERTLTRPLTTHYSLQLSGLLKSFWEIRGYFSEGRGYLQRALALTVTDTNADDTQAGKTDRIKALYAMGRLAYTQGDFASAQTYGLENLALSQEIVDKSGIANSMHVLGNIAYEQGNYTQAQVYYTESLHLRQQLGDKWAIGTSLNNLGIVAVEQQDYTQALLYVEESLSIAQQIGSKIDITLTLSNLGSIAIAQGNYNQAQTYLEKGSLIARELGGKKWLATILTDFGNLATKQKNYNQAFSYLEEGLSLHTETSNKRGISYTLVNFILLASKQQQRASFSQTESKECLQWIACLSGALASLLATIKLELVRMEAKDYRTSLETARIGLTEAEFAGEFSKGQAMSWQEAVEFAFRPSANIGTI